MRLFRGRPCAVCAALFVCAAAAAKYLRTAAFYAVCAFLSAAAAALFVILASRGKVSRERLISAAAVIALVFAFLIRCFALYIGVYGPLEDYAAGTHSLEGRVVSPGYLTPYSSSFTADITAVDGVECRVTADVSLPYAATGLSAGQTFSLSDATVSRTDVSSDRFAEGIMLDVTSGSEFGFVPGRTDKTLMYRASALNRRLSGMIAESVGGREGGLCAAMLLGSREYLDASVKRDFGRSGASHMLAVSGMHMSVVAALILFALTRMRVGKRMRLAVMFVVIPGYLLLLGFPVSAVRSAVMIVCGYAGWFTGADVDRVNALGIAVCAILMRSPAAVFDVSFILSAASTLGITGAAAYFEKRRRDRQRERNIRRSRRRSGEVKIGRPVSAAGRLFFAAADSLSDFVLPPLVALAAANMLTVLPTSVFFGEISLMSPVSNVILAPAATLVIGLSMLLIPFGSLPFISGFLSFYAGRAASFMLDTASRISSLRDVSLSLRYPFVPYILIPMTAATVLLLSLDLRHRGLVFAPAAAAAAAMAVCCFLYLGGESGKRVDALFLTGKSGDSAVMCGGGRALVCDVSSGGTGMMYAAAAAAAERGVTETEVLMLTHYHAAHRSSVASYMSRYVVRQLWMPEPKEESDASVALSLAALAEEAGVKCVFYRDGSELIAFGGVRVVPSGITRIKRSTHPVFYMKIGDSEENAVYVGKSSWEGDSGGVASASASADTVIAGTHGPVAKPAPAGYRIPLGTGGPRLCLLDHALAIYYLVPDAGRGNGNGKAGAAFPTGAAVTVNANGVLVRLRGAPSKKLAFFRR